MKTFDLLKVPKGTFNSQSYFNSRSTVSYYFTHILGLQNFNFYRIDRKLKLRLSEHFFTTREASYVYVYTSSWKLGRILRGHENDSLLIKTGDRRFYKYYKILGLSENSLYTKSPKNISAKIPTDEQILQGLMDLMYEHFGRRPKNSDIDYDTEKDELRINGVLVYDNGEIVVDYNDCPF